MRYTIILPHDYEWDATEWAKENCPSYLSATAHIRLDRNLPASKIEYHFADEADAAIFTLRWI